MLGNHNKERGKQLFIQKISAALAGARQEVAARLLLLHQGFEDQVGVMPMDGLYGASRMASACVVAAYSDVEDSQLVAEAVRVLKEGVPALEVSLSDKARTRLTPLRPEEVAAIAEIDARLEAIKGSADQGTEYAALTARKSHIQNHNYGVMSEATFSDENKVIYDALVAHEAPVNIDGCGRMGIEKIDLIKDTKRSNLSLEGMRRVGLLPANFDATDVVDDGEIQDEDEVFGNVHYDDAGNVQCVECPNCHVLPTRDVPITAYAVSYGVWGCFFCEKEFRVDMGLEDMFDSVADAPVKIEIARA